MDVSLWNVLEIRPMSSFGPLIQSHMLDIHVSYLVPQEKKKKMLLKVLGYLCAGEPIDVKIV